MSGSKPNGYSMIEVMVGITLFAVIMFVSVNLFLDTTIGSTKDNTTRTIKQTGDFMLLRMENALRGATGVTPCNPTMDTITIVTDDPDLGPLDSQVWTVTEEGIIEVDGYPLIDGDISVDGALNITCTHTVSTGSTFVTVSFTLHKGDPADVKSYVRETFETSVSLRNRI